jgi:putative N6-adenine-specific DNA methylase
MESLYAVCSPGLERFTAEELRALGLDCAPSAPGSGGVGFRGSLHDLYRANLRLRTAERVLLTLGEFRATKFPELQRKAAGLPWDAFLRPDAVVAWQVDCRRSRLYHERGVAERLAQAVGRPAGRGPGAQLVVVRVLDDTCRIGLDSSGEPLHRRGWRLAGAKAPLRETLASALLMESGWQPGAPLLDPFCGSGTIPIEAALAASGAAPGLLRDFAFMGWPGFDRAAWDRLKEQARAPASPASGAVRGILGSDRDAGAVRAARSNAERAGAAGCVELSCRAVSAVEPPPGPGWVVSNPPYGVRVRGGRDLRDLYAQLGKVLRARCPGWRVTLLCPDPRLLRETGLRLERELPMLNGGLRVKAVSGAV